MERTLAGLGKRRFLLHNVHEDHAVVFTTRWVMSYLAGPFTREQIKRLMADRAGPAQPGARTDSGPVVGDDITAQGRPPLPPGTRQVFLPLRQALPEAAEVVYYPCLLGAGRAESSPGHIRIHVVMRYTAPLWEARRSIARPLHYVIRQGEL